MNTVLIEPTDVLFFRDAIPMSAGQGRGAGCRMPFPSTLHEAIRGSLLRANGGTTGPKTVPGRPATADRSGNWHAAGHDGRTFIASADFRSLRTVGPLPFLDTDAPAGPLVWQELRRGQPTGVEVHYSGLLLPVPADVAFETVDRSGIGPDGTREHWKERPRLRRVQLLPDGTTRRDARSTGAGDYRPDLLPVAVTPPDKHGQLAGWWTVSQYRAYLESAPGTPAREDNAGEFFRPVPAQSLWEPEHRVGVRIEPGTFAAVSSGLYAGTHLRAQRRTRFAVGLAIADPAQATGAEAEARRREREQVSKLDWLLLGGEFRLARLQQKTRTGQPLADGFADIARLPDAPRGDGPCLLKWILVTPAIFAHGSLPGWCCDSRQNPPATGGRHPMGRVCLKDLPGRARLVSWCLAKPRTVSGWDVVDEWAKPTLLAVPEGGVYYFLCENAGTAAALAARLHWQPRSDYYGEKGCGYGVVSHDVALHPDSPDLRTLAAELLKD